MIKHKGYRSKLLVIHEMNLAFYGIGGERGTVLESDQKRELNILVGIFWILK
jgi:hypothetical protein